MPALSQQMNGPRGPDIPRARTADMQNARPVFHRVFERVGVPIVFLAVFVFHARWIFVHFSNDGYLCDSGWIAFLFERADPLLRNPRAVVGTACAGVNAPTFMAHHLSPHIFLFGAPFAMFGISGIDILAYHQGLFFGLFFVAMYLVAARAGVAGRDRLTAMLVGIAVGTLGNALLQAAAYPHYETAMFALASLAIASVLAVRHGLSASCLICLPLVREDGGLYAAFVCLACLAVEYGGRRPFDRRASMLGIAAAAGVVASGAAVL